MTTDEQIAVLRVYNMQKDALRRQYSHKLDSCKTDEETRKVVDEYAVKSFQPEDEYCTMEERQWFGEDYGDDPRDFEEYWK